MVCASVRTVSTTRSPSPSCDNVDRFLLTLCFGLEVSSLLFDSDVQHAFEKFRFLRGPPVFLLCQCFIKSHAVVLASDAFFGHLFRCCCLHHQTWNHSAPHFVGFTSLLAKSEAVRSVDTQGNHVRMAGMHASCAAKAGMERRIAAPERSLQRRHQPSSPLHHQPCSHPQSAPEPSQPPVFVPGFGCKGKGEVANYGVAIAPPNGAKEEDLPLVFSSPAVLRRLKGSRPFQNHH